jgi:type IV pilus assembly protein PilM
MAEETSIWKKEIRLGKRRTPSAPKPSGAAEMNTGEMNTGEKKPSIWKREIKLGRPAGSLSSPVLPADPEPAASHPDEPASELGTPFEPLDDQVDAAHEQTAPPEQHASLFAPVPEWDGPPPLDLPLAGKLPIAVPSEDARQAPQSAENEPVPWWRRTDEHASELSTRPEGGTVGESSVGWTIDTEREPEGLSPAGRAGEPAAAEDASVPTGQDDPQAWEQQVASEARMNYEPQPVEDLHAGLPNERSDQNVAHSPQWSTGSEAHDSPGMEEPLLDLPVEIPWALESADVEATPDPGPQTALQPEAPKSELTTVSKPKQSLLKRELHFPRPSRRKSSRAARATASASVPRKLVGLRIGSSQLAAACVHNNGSAELVQFARTSLGHGIVSGGEVRDPEALTRALKAFFAEHKLPRRGVRLGIASNRIGVRILEVPAVDDPKLFENSIRFHAQETLPIAVTDAVLDHVVLGEAAGQGLEKTMRVLLVFAHREFVDRYVEVCRRAGVKLDGIDFEAFALLRALAEQRPAEVEPRQAVVAVAVGQERTIFAVSDGRICDFTRVLEWGGGSLDVVIARALDLTPSQAEPIKLALSLDGQSAPSQLSDDQVEAARAAIRTELKALSRELVSSLQFYQARAGSLDIGEILLSGGGAQLAGFAAELERLVGVPVRIGDPFAHVELGKKVSLPAESGSLAVAIGLGIEY